MRELKKETQISPNALELEGAILGAMLTSESALWKGLEITVPKIFYGLNHRIIFETIREIVEGKRGGARRPDLLTVKEELERKGLLEQAGGASYLAEIVEKVINPEYIEEHIKIVTEKFILRETIEVCQRIIQDCYREEFDPEFILDNADLLLFQLRTFKLKEGFIPVKELLKPVFDNLNAIIMRTGIELSSGYPSLDNITTGFHKGDFIVIASRPSMGKTSFALNIIRNLAVKRAKPCALFSIEMTKEHIVERLLCMEAQISMQNLRRGNIGREDMRLLTTAADILREAPIFIDDTPKIHLQELRAKARRAVKEHKVEIIFVDFLQLIDAPKSETRQQQIALISANLKALAMELDIPVVALSQLSREPEKRSEDKRPRLADLRESGAIEQDADLVIFIYRDEVYHRDTTETPGIAEINVAKHRNGKTDSIKLNFREEYMLFEEMESEEREEEILF